MAIKAFSALLLFLFLTACGFQLRGTSPMPEILNRVAIEPNTPSLPLNRQIRELLQVNGVTVVNASQQPTAILHIQNEEFQTLDTSIGVDGRIREQSYTYIVTFQVTDAKGRKLMEPETIRSTRIIEFNPNAALSQNLEEKIIHHEARLDVVSQLIRRVSHLQPPAENS